MTHFCALRQGINPDQSDGDGALAADGINAAQIRSNWLFLQGGK
jgi:hypothetical protein